MKNKNYEETVKLLTNYKNIKGKVDVIDYGVDKPNGALLAMFVSHSNQGLVHTSNSIKLLGGAK